MDYILLTLVAFLLDCSPAEFLSLCFFVFVSAVRLAELHQEGH